MPAPSADFFVPQHLVVARFFDVEDFSLERQDGLVLAVAPALGRPACGLALDDEQLAPRGIALLAIGELSRQAPRIHGGLAPRQFARLAGRFASARGVNAFADDAARDGRVLVEIFSEAFVDQLLDWPLDVAVEFPLGLAFELRLRQFHGNDGDKSLTHVIAGDGDFILLLFQHVRGRSEIVDRPRQRGAETGKMRPAVHRVDGVGKGKHIFRVAVVVLQGDFDFDGVFLALHVDGRVVQHLLALIQMLDEFSDAAGETELDGFVAALVGERDFQAFVQEGELAQPLRQNVVAVLVVLKNRGIGMKRNLRAGLASFSRALQLGLGFSFVVGLFPHFAVAPDFEFQPVGQRVHHRDAHAVQPARNFVGVAVEFSASVQHGHHHFRRGPFFRGVHVHGNAAAVVRHRDAIVLVHHYVDLVAKSGEGFVDRIVDDFPDEVVQPHLARRADVHRRALAHGLEAAQHLDRRRVVAVSRFISQCRRFFSHIVRAPAESA
jgi:hypothetical protein